jgi:hypothetical protein
VHDDSPADCPAVSVIMTALDEERHLADAVRSVFEQDYSGPIELVVAVGPSKDRTRAIADELAAGRSDMRVVENPTGRTPAGLNLALAATDPSRPVIVRTDGHAHLPRSYIRVAVETMQRSGAANVGGMMLPEGTTAFERAVARAMSARIGMGSVSFHTGGGEGPAQTVYLGVFRRSILARTGGFDERFARAQDWELNYRIRRTGATVWFDPRLRVGYRPRSSLKRLATQFHGGGTWRWQIIRVYPRTASARYLAAPAATTALGLAGVALVLDAVAIRSVAVAVGAALVPGTYLTAVAIGCATSRRGLDAAASAWFPVVVVTMHLSWGVGFLSAAARDAARALQAGLPWLAAKRQLRRSARPAVASEL